MKFELIIDKSKEETIVATVHEPSALTRQIELLVLQATGNDRLAVYDEDNDLIMLSIRTIECITVIDGKTYAIDSKNRKYRLRQRLYELEKTLPASFIRINKSALANKEKLDRFSASFNGAVDAVFKCGYREYVSRRCFSEIKRRFEQ